jgi:hypothetical protein
MHSSAARPVIAFLLSSRAADTSSASVLHALDRRCKRSHSNSAAAASGSHRRCAMRCDSMRCGAVPRCCHRALIRTTLRQCRRGCTAGRRACARPDDAEEAHTQRERRAEARREPPQRPVQRCAARACVAGRPLERISRGLALRSARRIHRRVGSRAMMRTACARSGSQQWRGSARGARRRRAWIRPRMRARICIINSVCRSRSHRL